MLKRRIIAAVVALLVSALGGALLISYVARADERAMAGMETSIVLVATSVIPKGTAAESLADVVTTKVLPVKALTEGTLGSLSAVKGKVSTVDLQPGEQLLGSRFVDPASLEETGEIEIPPGLEQVSVSMERARMLGGTLTPGASVGVFVSLAKEDKQPAQTHLVLHKVLVTQVGEGGSPAPVEEGTEAAPTAETVLVTFALSATDAEKLVFGVEHGRLWLSLEPEDSTTSGTQVVTPENLYR